MHRLLLHVCCGPCSTHVIKVLKDEYDLTLYYYNPNIHPKAEYEHRLREAKKVAKNLGVPLIEGPYDPRTWHDAVKGYEGEPENGKRCPVCFDVRLQKTAQFAEEGGFDFFTTTLTVSPYKVTGDVNLAGEEAAMGKKVEFLLENFKKKDGYKHSLEMSKELELYRQHYCGCCYSCQEPPIKDR